MRISTRAKIVYCFSAIGIMVAFNAAASEPGNSSISGVNCPWVKASGVDVNNLQRTAAAVITSPYSNYYVVTRTLFLQTPEVGYYFYLPLGNEVLFFNISNSSFYVQYPLFGYAPFGGTFTGSFVANNQNGHTATLKLSCGDTLSIVTTQGGS